MAFPELKRLRWVDVYNEAQLYKAAVRLYTTPIFNWRKALGTSSDQKNFYDFARNGLSKLGRLHEKLEKGSFKFRPGISLDFNFNGRRRIVYVYPWEERLIDLLLYRVLNQAWEKLFSANSFAYRLGGGGIDVCQRRIKFALQKTKKPTYIIKRDISNYFNSVDHDALTGRLGSFIEEKDYLFTLLQQRIKFSYLQGNTEITARAGIPFGTAIACVFANIYLTELDYSLSRIPGLRYFRYSDDIIFFSQNKKTSRGALEVFNAFLARLKLTDNFAQRKNILFSRDLIFDEFFNCADKFKHLGLEFKADGLIRLSRDKFRKICNIFKYALRRKQGRLKKLKDVEKRIELVIQLINQTLNSGIRNIAIVDYYLRHVSDEVQIRLLDRWLAEETLAVILNAGHKRGNFRKISFNVLRSRGLPSLAHRRRLIIHGRLKAPFFIWKNYQVSKARKGTAARPLIPRNYLGQSVFSPFPKAAAIKNPCEKEALPVDGRY